MNALRKQGDMRSRGQQVRHKRNYDERVTAEPKFASNHCVFKEKILLTDGAPTIDSIATSIYSKQEHRTTDLHKILEGRKNTIVIDKNRVHDNL